MNMLVQQYEKDSYFHWMSSHAYSYLANHDRLTCLLRTSVTILADSRFVVPLYTNVHAQWSARQLTDWVVPPLIIWSQTLTDLSPLACMYAVLKYFVTPHSTIPQNITLHCSVNNLYLVISLSCEILYDCRVKINHSFYISRGGKCNAVLACLIRTCLNEH